MTSSGSVLSGVQYLRALAAVMVVILHATYQLDQTRQIFNANFGNAGVDIFFLISGFIMTYIISTREISPARFFVNRVVRIAPLYWFMTFVTLSLTVVMPQVFNATTFDLTHFLASLSFIAIQNPSDPGSANPLLQVGWTLNYEMLFYVICALSLMSSKKYWYLIVAGILILMVCFGQVAKPTNIVSIFYTSDIMLEFILGIVICKLYLGGLLTFSSPGYRAILFVVGLSLLVYSGTFVDESWPVRSVYFGLPAALLLLAAVAKSNAHENRFLLLLGDSSYALYLVHPFVVSGVRVVLDKIFSYQVSNGLELFVGTTLAIALSLIAGVLLHWIVEKPVNLILKQMVSRKAGLSKSLYSES